MEKNCEKILFKSCGYYSGNCFFVFVCNSYDSSYDFYDFKYSIEANVLKLANSNILENLEKLNRTGAFKMVCTVDEGGRLKDIMNEQSMGENTLSEESLDELKDDIMNFN